MSSFEYPDHVKDPENYAWRERAWRRPSVPDDETIVIDEPGRLLPCGGGRKVCCRSFHFVVSQGPLRALTLRVKHGGGEESWRLGWDSERLLAGFVAMDSDSRFRMLLTLANAHSNSRREGYAAAERHWSAAVEEGRVRRKKIRGQDRYQAVILPPPHSPASPRDSKKCR